MSGLLKILGALAPPPSQPAAREFDGWQVKLGPLVFRPAAFKFEGIMLSILLGYVLLYFIGRFYNQSRAKSALAPYKPFLDTQFSQTKPLVSSSPAQHLLYSSGRRNVLFLHTTLKLVPFHDPATLLIELANSVLDPINEFGEALVFNFTLGRGDYGRQGEGLGVWAVVDKGYMRVTKQQRWDLSFARLYELASLPQTHALFTEHSDVTDVVLKTANVGFTDLLNNPAAASVLKYFLITDVPARRPAKGTLPAKFRSREIVISVHKPKNQQQVEAIKAWLQVALNIADLLEKPNLLKPDVTRKLVASRKSADDELNKDYQRVRDEDKPAEDTAEDKRAAKKRAERALMSEKELKKAEELDRKREMRKMQKKQGPK